ncbi:MAG TPA: urate hydroxylase PuuD [Candidatus Kapabacteria bacterium]|nr:urate hydroxylase PuuD [Candidatus Kapabacteria bacterium]
MGFVDYLSLFARWMHILAGIMWIGLLWFFNFVNGPFTGALDGDTKKKVIPELAPRALYFFRWGAAWTWIWGIILLGLVFETGHIYLSNPQTVSFGSGLLLWSFLLAPFIYDFLAKSALAKNPKVFAIICAVLTVVIIWLLESCSGFGYRGSLIYIGAMFGTMMAYNVWFRIWPNQKLIITGVKTGNPADASVVALAGSRSKHNTYMSVPLVWAMINVHSAAMASSVDWLTFGIVIFIGWMAANGIYKRAAKVKGF